MQLKLKLHGKMKFVMRNTMKIVIEQAGGIAFGARINENLVRGP